MTAPEPAQCEHPTASRLRFVGMERCSSCGRCREREPTDDPSGWGGWCWSFSFPGRPKAKREDVGAMADQSLVEATPGVCGGRARIAGTRISVCSIEALRRSGASEEQILATYPNLTRPRLVAAFEYSRSHGDEIARDIAEQEGEPVPCVHPLPSRSYSAGQERCVACGACREMSSYAGIIGAYICGRWRLPVPLPDSRVAPKAKREGVDIDELRRLLADATPGPWCVHPNGTSAWQGEDYDSSGMLSGHGMVLRGIASAATGRELADVDLAVALRNAAPALLDEVAEVERLRSENVALRGELDGFLPAMDGGVSASTEALGTNAALRVEVERLRGALRQAAEICDANAHAECDVAEQCAREIRSLTGDDAAEGTSR